MTSCIAQPNGCGSAIGAADAATTNRGFLRDNTESAIEALLNNPAAITVSNLRDGTYRFANDSFLRLSGYRREEILGCAAPQLGIWERPEERGILVSALRRHGRCENLETRLRCQDGRICIVQVSASTLDVAGQSCLLAVVTDITEQRRHEQALAGRLTFEKTTAAILSALFRGADDDDAIPDNAAQDDAAVCAALALVGEFTRADRCYVYRRPDAEQVVQDGNPEFLTRHALWNVDAPADRASADSPPDRIDLQDQSWARGSWQPTGRWLYRM